MHKKEQKKQVIELSKQNLTQSEIARIVGVSNTTVRRWLNENGINNKVGISQSSIIAKKKWKAELITKSKGR